MSLEIKQLKQNGTIFVPQTVAEAVLVKQSNSSIITLDKILNRKLETAKSSDGSLAILKIGNELDIKHTNQIVEVENIKPMQIKYDRFGHITESKPLGSLIITANKQQVLEIDGSTNQELEFGDDFQKNEQNIITLRWNNHGNT